MIDDITLYINKNKHYTAEIDKNKALADGINNLEDLKEHKEGFFELKSIEEKDGKYLLNYIIEDEYRPLIEAKKYSPVMRLALLETVLKVDPLLKLNELVPLHPQNIFFKDLRTVKFMYRSNRWLPYEEKLLPLEQYKILALSILSKYSYEQFKIKKQELLAKEKSDFYYNINNTRNLEELQRCISKELYKVETEHFFGLVESQKKKKRGFWQKAFFITGSVIVVLLLFAGVTKYQMNKVAREYEGKLDRQEKVTQFYQALSNNNTGKAVKLLKENGAKKSQIAELYFKHGQYNKAIDTDPSYVKKVINHLYKKNKKDEILSLAPRNKSDYLDTEKKIIQYDYSFLTQNTPLIDDKDQLRRIGLAFVEHNSLLDARNVEQRTKDKVLNKAIKQKDLENSITKAKNNLKELKKGKDKEKIKAQEKELDALNKQLDEIKGSGRG